MASLALNPVSREHPWLLLHTGPGVPIVVAMKARFLIPLLALTAGLITSCARAPQTATMAPPPAPRLASAATGIDLSGMDTSVLPGDDFFAFANGTWIKNTEIPADRSAYGAGAILSELTAKRVSELIGEAARSQAAEGSETRKIGDTYTAFMDEAAIEAKGLTPLEPSLRQIAAISNPGELAQALGSSLRADVDAFNATDLYTPNIFGLWVAQDLNNPNRYSPFLLQGGLGMPDRDYYLDPSPRMAGIRARYQEHIAAVLKLSGSADPEGKASRILELERLIAQTHATRDDSGDILKGNNHWKREDFEKQAPGMNWQAFFLASRLEKQDEFVVWQPSAVIGVAALAGNQPLSTWKDYLHFRAIENASTFLSKAYVDEQFAFYGKVLSGTPKLRDRWKRAIDVTDEALGEAIGKLYVARYFPPTEKARAEAMVRNQIVAFGHRIDQLAWMTPETKARAKAKLAILKVGVGYPDKWRDYSGLEVIKGDALGNAQRASLFEYKERLKKLGGPVDRGEWVMNPQLVNAVNLPAMNALNFPAAILQPPYFDSDRPEVMDYGAAGSIIGHEISHSFDDQGALFDETGRLENWWTKEDFAHFAASAERLVKQYSAYRPFPDLSVNGRLTLGENIADVAGLAVAYDAYRLSLGGKEAPPFHGLTGDQQFFVSFAQGWRQKFREPALRQRVVVDSHAPAEYRADTVRNLDAWYPAFDVKPGQKLYLAQADRVQIW